MCTPSRNTQSIPSVNRMRLRSSGMRQMLVNQAVTGRLPSEPPRSEPLSLGDLDRPARGFDLRLGGGRGLRDLHLEGDLDVPVAEELDAVLPDAGHDPGVLERSGIDRGALLEGRELADVHLGVVLGEDVREATL